MRFFRKESIVILGGVSNNNPVYFNYYGKKISGLSKGGTVRIVVTSDLLCSPSTLQTQLLNSTFSTSIIVLLGMTSIISSVM